jgi:hypothetical protein
MLLRKKEEMRVINRILSKGGCSKINFGFLAKGK